jgi:hypothetical protein
MNKYLAKLHRLQHGSGAQNQKTCDRDEPSKPSKLGSDGFDGDQGMPFFGNSGVAKVSDPSAKRMAEDAKNVTPSNPQNPQNFGSQSVPQGACRVQVVEIPATGGHYRKIFAYLQLKPPAHIREDRWRQAVDDGRAFLQQWAERAAQLGWTSADLFGLHTPPDKPHPSYDRLSRYDETGLIWLLQGRPVVGLTALTAAIQNPSESITCYRKHNKPATGPLGDTLEDFK